jgi:hypothetical protein
MKIISYWQTETGIWNNNLNKYEERNKSEIIEKEIDLIYIVNKQDTQKDIIKFVGGPTGHESYYIKDILNHIQSKAECLYICAGTINRWPSCYVYTKDIYKFIKMSTITLFTNKRKIPEDFNAQYHCTFCDPNKTKFSLKLIEIENQLICKSCLDEMINTINKSILEDIINAER